MAYQVEVIADGNSLGITLPDELLARLNVQKGDTLCLTETPTGIQITREDRKMSGDMAE